MERFEVLEIDDHIDAKIESRHGLTFVEVYEAVSSLERHVRRCPDGRYKVFSRTDAGRYILVVLADHGAGRWKVVTAREMTATERRLYRQATGS
ncbi:MAG: BrnT family toxin [Chloroflexi bacterium]|nr:BrnT family toxin [Chloroflexota bacterium]